MFVLKVDVTSQLSTWILQLGECYCTSSDKLSLRVHYTFNLLLNFYPTALS